MPQILAELKPCPGIEAPGRLEPLRDQRAVHPARPARKTNCPPRSARSGEDVASAETATDLLALIRRSIGSYGYGPARVVFELFQNADDATLQHPPEGDADVPGRFRARTPATAALGTSHQSPWPSGRGRNARGWQRDLFNMLLLNLFREARGGDRGGFGLGVQERASYCPRGGDRPPGFEASCRVKGGMLPEVWEVGRTLSPRRKPRRQARNSYRS